MQPVINPRSGVPIYRQLADQLRADIITGRLRPGQKLPSERTLIQTHGISRDTVRSALHLLKAEGQIVVRQGQGAFVKERVPAQLLVPPAGATVTARMPTPQERAELDIDEGVPVFWVVAADGSGTAYPGDRWELRL